MGYLKVRIWASLWIGLATPIMANNLVSPKTIAKQKSLTKTFVLKNKVPVIFRQVNDSDIIQISINFPYALKDTPHQQKALLAIMADTIPKGGKNWSKEKIYRLTEKYSASIDCNSGIEFSTCSLSAVNDYWEKILPAFAAVITSPTFKQKEITLATQRHIAGLKSQAQDPGQFSNEVVNRVFYPNEHPYRLSLQESINQLEKAKRKQVIDLHKKLLNSGGLFITVASSLSQAQLQKSLNQAFISLKNSKTKPTPVIAPKFVAKNFWSMEHRNIPSAYIRTKFNMPGIKDPDYLPSKLMIKILDEELGIEIRTKQSLSYAVYSYAINYQIGLGVISASTSFPEKTLAAMNSVVKKIKTTQFSKKTLEEYKNVYATNYFLTLEEHASLVAAMTSTYHFHGNTDPMYDLPEKLKSVTPAQITKMANKYLKNFRVGIVYDKNKIQEKWVKSFVMDHHKGR